MARVKYASIETVSNIVRTALSRGAAVEIDGLGLFRKIGKRYHFHASDLPRIFVAYAHEDRQKAGHIFDQFLDAGLDPWMDERKLLAGQNWARAIRNAMETADFIVCCFSTHSLHKRGGFQAEIRYALESAKRLPLDEVFLLPVRLDDCPIPVEVASQMQYVDLFPDWQAGVGRLIESVRRQSRRRWAA